MREAIARFVDDGDVVAAEGFTHLIPFAAGHEMIRQGKNDLVLCRLTPDLIYDPMVAAGLARKLIFGWIGNPGVGSLHAIRRAVEDGIPHRLEIEEYSHFGLLSRSDRMSPSFTRSGPTPRAILKCGAFSGCRRRSRSLPIRSRCVRSQARSPAHLHR